MQSCRWNIRCSLHHSSHRHAQRNILGFSCGFFGSFIRIGISYPSAFVAIVSMFFEQFHLKQEQHAKELKLIWLFFHINSQIRHKVGLETTLNFLSIKF